MANRDLQDKKAILAWKFGKKESFRTGIALFRCRFRLN